jgi:hypothetical protein
MNYFEGMFAHESAPDAKAMTEHELFLFAMGECLDNALLAAFHESGHAVAGHILGHPCTKIVMDGYGNIPIPEGPSPVRLTTMAGRMSLTVEAAR